MKHYQFLYAFAFTLALGFLTACNSSKSGEPVTLKFNLEKGKSYEYEMDVNMENEVQGQKMKSNMEFDYLIEVIDDQGGVKTVKSTYQRVKMEMDMPNAKIDIDTDKPQDTTTMDGNPLNMMSPMFYAIKGKSFTMKVDAEGKVTEVNGIQEMQEAMLNGLNVDEEAREQFEIGFKSQFNEENLKQSFSQAFNIFPNKPVKVGDSWNKEMTMGGGAMKMNTTYTVKSISGNKVTLDASSTFDMMGSKGNQTGTFVVNANTGLVTKGEYTQTFDGPMKMTSKGEISGEEK